MGKKWGNALGGFRFQNRNKGKFASGFSGRAKNFAKNSRPGAYGSEYHKKAKARGGGFVPYHRTGVGHNTVGVNAGMRVTRNRRISAGFYVRTTSDSGEKRAKKIAKTQEKIQLQVAKTMPTGNGVTLGGNLKRVKKEQNKLVRKGIGREYQSGEHSFSRIGTDRNALPTLVTRYNSPKSGNKRRDLKRNKAVANYNTYFATGKRSLEWTQKKKKKRPARRKKAASR